MASTKEIELFLRDFKVKLEIWGLLIRADREKNYKTMLTLEYSVEDVKKELRSLQVIHYAEGPVEEKLYNGATMWVFGKVIQSQEVYIKISLGLPGNNVFCISFHFSEKPLSYPYK